MFTNHSVAYRVLFLILAPLGAQLHASELFDNFDDGNYDGWIVGDPITHHPYVEPPQVVASPEGYALRGTRSGYTNPDWSNWLYRPVTMENVGALSIEMRAKSGATAPNQAVLWLIDGDDFYYGRDYGESTQAADWYSRVNAVNDLYRYPIGTMAYEWHTFRWSRDGSGWWSLAVDDQIVAPNFRQDAQLTSFGAVAIELHRNLSEIEWVRVVPEPSTLALLALGVPGLIRRRRA